MRAPRPLLPLLLLGALAGCGWNSDPFAPVWLVDKVRILGVRAEPADVAPGGTTRLDALVADPDAGSRPLTKVWLLCDPDPAAATGGACAKYGTARDPAEFLQGRVPGVRVAGGDEVAYTAPAEALAGLEPGSVQRLRGVTATVLLVVIEGDDLAAAGDPARSHYAIKRIRIGDPADPPPNRNPQIERVELDGAALDPAARTEVKERATVQLKVVTADGSAQDYERIGPDGTREPQTERLVASWYADAGGMPDLQDRSARVLADQPVRLELPSAQELPGGVVTFHVVVRDARGGMARATRELRVVP